MPFREIDRLAAENASLEETNANLRSIADSKDAILTEVVAENAELLAVCQKLGELDWCIGYELVEQNQIILDAAITMARKATATTPSEKL